MQNNPRTVIFIFKRNDGCLGTFQLSSNESLTIKLFYCDVIGRTGDVIDDHRYPEEDREDGGGRGGRVQGPLL